MTLRSHAARHVLESTIRLIQTYCSILSSSQVPWGLWELSLLVQHSSQVSIRPPKAPPHAPFAPTHSTAKVRAFIKTLKGNGEVYQTKLLSTHHGHTGLSLDAASHRRLAQLRRDVKQLSSDGKVLVGVFFSQTEFYVDGLKGRTGDVKQTTFQSFLYSISDRAHTARDRLHQLPLWGLSRISRRGTLGLDK